MDTNNNNLNSKPMQDALPEIKGVDIAQGVARFGGKRDRYLAALRKFTNSMPVLMPDDPYENGSFKSDMLENIHTIKGVSANLGITEFSLLIKDFEVTLKAGNPDSVLYERLVALRKEIVDEILSNTSEAATSAATLERGRYADYAQLLKQLKTHLENSDINECEQTLSDLQAKTWGYSRNKLISQLVSSVNDYELDEALALLNTVSHT